MKAHRIVTLIAPGFLLVLVQLVAAIANPLLGLLAGACIGGLAWGALRVLDSDLKYWWSSSLLAFVSSILGVGISLLSAHAGNGLWLVLALAPVLAGGVAALWHLITNNRARRCDICNRRLTAQFFVCPRCSKIACEQHCWIFDGCRCRRCEETSVPILSGQTMWWDRYLGPRIRQGQCQLCLTSAGKADLRTCQECGRPYCRTCWDTLNGQCRNCLWTIPAVPVAVRAYLVPHEGPSKTSRTARRNLRSTRIE